MKKTVLPAILLLCTTLFAVEDQSPKPDRSIVYKKTDQGELKLHIFNPSGHVAGEKTPVIVFFHGGGWTGGGPSQFFHQCRHLASRGMVAISAEYRLGKKHGTTPRECVQDGKSAVRWVRSHATQLGIDPDQLAAGGGSAGGHVAAAVALTEGFNETGEDLAVSCRPNALVLFNPVIDNGPDGYGHTRVKSYWESFSPLHNIGSSNPPPPPTLFMLGTKDSLIPVATGQKYKERMEAAGARCDLALYPDQPHGFFNIKNEVYHKKTSVEMDRFLTSIGFLKPAKTQLQR